MRTILLIIMVTIMSSCNKIKSTFEADLRQYFVNVPEQSGILNASDITHLPSPVQRHFNYCGYVGHERITNAEVVWADSHIKMNPDKNWMKLKTVQYNCTQSPFRIALMKARIAGVIPFQGRDLYAEGQGHMYGKLAHIITVFDEKVPEISQSALVIILAESLLIPGYALADYIFWELIDDNSAKATIKHYGITATGIFHFDADGALLKFESAERYYMHPEQGNILKPFTALVGPYKQQENLKIPSTLRAVWNLENGDYEYWKGTIKEVRYNISLGSSET